MATGPLRPARWRERADTIGPLLRTPERRALAAEVGYPVV